MFSVILTIFMYFASTISLQFLRFLAFKFAHLCHKIKIIFTSPPGILITICVELNYLDTALAS